MNKKVQIIVVLIAVLVLTSIDVFGIDLKKSKGKGESNSRSKQKVLCGIEGGFNFANYEVKSDFASYNNNVLVGLRIGEVVDIPLSTQFYLQTGLFYAMNGTKESAYYPSYGSFSETIRMHTLELPIDAIYKFGRPGSNRFFLGGGLFFGYNVGGKITNSSSGNNANINIGTKSTDDIKPLDIGLGTHIGFQMASGLMFRLRFQSGVANLSPTTVYGMSIHSSGISLMVGYLFNNNRNKSVK